MNKQKTGGLIAAIRKEKGLTQEQLGEKLYVTAKAVSKWERGDSAPGVDLLEPLARELGISVTELLAGERVEPEDLNQKAQQLALQMLRREKQAIYWTILLAATVMVLAVVLVLHRWGPAIFQRGNPIPYLAAAARLTTASAMFTFPAAMTVRNCSTRSKKSGASPLWSRRAADFCFPTGQTGWWCPPRFTGGISWCGRCRHIHCKVHNRKAPERVLFSL